MLRLSLDIYKLEGLEIGKLGLLSSEGLKSEIKVWSVLVAVETSHLPYEGHFLVVSEGMPELSPDLLLKDSSHRRVNLQGIL